MRAILAVLVVVNALLLVLYWMGVIATPGDVHAEPVVALPDGVPELTLLSEAGDSLPAVASDRRDSAPSDSVADALPLCTLVGPFAESGDADSLAQRLQALDIAADIRGLEVSDGQGYWVHLAPELSQREALRRLHELQAKQIDSYIIPRGELANGISFGMFSRQPLAEARQAELIALGYDAKIREVERTHRETWVVMPAPQAQALAASLWDELLAGHPELERRQNLCPGVASQ